MNKHHIIPKSKFEWVETNLELNDKDNIKMLPEKFHTAIHRLFQNMTPKEQLELLYEINYKVMKYKTKQDLVNLFTLKDSEFYK